MTHARIFITLTLILLAFAATELSHAKGKNVITKDQLIEMFDNLPKKPDWDSTKPLLWGYFFTDQSKEKLETVAPLLAKQGYRVVDIFLSEKDNPKEPDIWWLHVEKVEIHNPETLNQRNMIFYQFADDNGIDSYDGMDVGPAPTNH